MKTNPYAAPKSDVSIEVPFEIPAKLAKNIRNGWIAAIVSGVMTIAIMILAITTGTLANLFDIWTSLDVILIFVLAFGIYKKSRTAATIMFVYFLASKIWIVVETGRASGLLMGFIFLYFYFQAMVATYQYHKLRKSN